MTDGSYDTGRVTLDAGLTALALRGLDARSPRAHFPFLDRHTRHRPPDRGPVPVGAQVRSPWPSTAWHLLKRLSGLTFAMMPGPAVLSVTPRSPHVAAPGLLGLAGTVRSDLRRAGVLDARSVEWARS